MSSPSLQRQNAATDETEQMRAILVRAVARHCPRALASQAEDLVQIALLRLLEHPAPEGSRPRGASYLWRVAFNVVVDEIRRRKRSEKYQAEAQSRTLQTAPGPDLGAVIRDCLSKLPETRRIPVTLHLQGFRLSEVATALGWNEKRAENLIFRGLAELRSCLAGKKANDEA